MLERSAAPRGFRGAPPEPPMRPSLVVGTFVGILLYSLGGHYHLLTSCGWGGWVYTEAFLLVLSSSPDLQIRQRSSLSRCHCCHCLCEMNSYGGLFYLTVLSSQEGLRKREGGANITLYWDSIIARGYKYKHHAARHRNVTHQL